MAIMPREDSSLESALEFLPPELVERLVHASWTMRSVNVATQATQAGMRQNQVHGAVTAASTLDIVARLGASAGHLTPEQEQAFRGMGDEYLKKVICAVEMGNNALLWELQETIAAARRNGGR